MTVDELCKGHPEEFREFMNYCRKLQFAEDPDYKFVLGLFEGCMKKNGWDPKVPDFIWNKNRLVLEKEALKQNLMKVISKPIKKLEAEEGGAAGAADDQKKKLEKNSITDVKPTVAAGKGIVAGTKNQFGDAQNQQASGTPYE